MDVKVEVRGIRELSRAFKAVDAELPKRLKARFLAIAETVASSARGNVPHRTGRAAASIKAKASARGAGIAFGGTAAPHYPWLDFGGSVGKGHFPGKRWSGSVTREWWGKPGGDGRYIYPAIDSHKQEITDAAEKAIADVARDAGLETH